MKPFDLQKALAGDPVITRAGDSVTQITRFEGVSRRENIYGVYDGRVGCWYENGSYFDDTDEEHPNDLFMVPKAKEGWINVYQTASGEWRTYGPIYDSEEEAGNYNGDEHPPVRIEWEAP